MYLLLAGFKHVQGCPLGLLRVVILARVVRENVGCATGRVETLARVSASLPVKIPRDILRLHGSLAPFNPAQATQATHIWCIGLNEFSNLACLPSLVLRPLRPRHTRRQVAATGLCDKWLWVYYLQNKSLRHDACSVHTQ